LSCYLRARAPRVTEVRWRLKAFLQQLRSLPARGADIRDPEHVNRQASSDNLRRYPLQRQGRCVLQRGNRRRCVVKTGEIAVNLNRR
jgi:hypothetical protein